MPLGREVGLIPGDCVLDGDPDPHKRWAQPQFSANIYCGQTAGCIKMPLGTEVGHGTGDIVLDGDPAPSPGKRGTPPIFGSCPLCQTAGWIKIPLGMEAGLGPGDFVVFWPNGWVHQDIT